MTLRRVDMEDRTGTVFCEACGADAMESGVFDYARHSRIRNPSLLLLGNAPGDRYPAGRMEWGKTHGRQDQRRKCAICGWKIGQSFTQIFKSDDGRLAHEDCLKEHIRGQGR